MFNPDDLANNASQRTRLVTGLACLIFAIGMGFVAWRTGDNALIFLALLSGAPVGFIGLLLLLNRLRNGIFSPFSLYFLGGAIALGTVLLTFQDISGIRTGGGLLLAFGCFALARKRIKKKSEW
jgi:ABC-type tungstate transport system substrate-binding protein